MNLHGLRQLFTGGTVMGRDTVWMMAASILTSFDISDPVDLDGNPITSDKDMVYTNNMVRCVARVMYATPRSDQVPLASPHRIRSRSYRA